MCGVILIISYPASVNLETCNLQYVSVAIYS